MNKGFFKSATALVMIASIAAPLPGMAQGNSNANANATGNAAIDISQMSDAEISELVERCRKRAERDARRQAQGKETKDNDGRVAQFCDDYAQNTFDAGLPADLQAATVLAGIDAEAESNTDIDVTNLADVIERTTDSLLDPTADAAANAEAGVEELAQALAGQRAELNAAAEAEAEAQAQAQAEGEAEATADTTADATVVDNPEVTEQNSQQQADALAESDTETTAAAAAADGDASANAEVTEETVTEESARSSDEEFDTKVNETAEAKAAPSTRANDDDDGLSKLEKAALLGLGAFAVGQLLKSGETVVSNSGDRAVVEQDGTYRVIKNDDALLRQPGSNVKTYQFDDGSTRTVVTREDGTEVETIRASDGRVLRRSKTLQDGRTVVLFDDTRAAEKVVVTDLPENTQPRAAFRSDSTISSDELAAALAAQQPQGVDRRFSLAQIRNIDAVRQLVPVINVDKVTFETGSSAVRAAQAEELSQLGNALANLIDKNPSEVFLIEGHTDAVGAATYNLALSDRRAETVALALTEYFNVPPENMVIQGYGESDLAIPVLDAERANRRVAVRRITPLLAERQ
ncbi:OmpA family protein [Tritonibacter horizontis]|uniref:Outer membrane porin F n=1 Tax=Tritonibacter horizontis TaxID=1768241 RepID=A0A132BRM6_9RHOB|nr:OmpA family protein [Tritonibacter horizontis]KUP90672.1 outer membrane porin F precursor [Tritonibacter horizontis]